MLLRQGSKRNALDVKRIALVGKVGLAGEILWVHGGVIERWVLGTGADAGLATEGGVALDEPGRRVSGRVARRAAAGSVGKYRRPCWPQPLKPATIEAAPIKRAATKPAPLALTALTARANGLTKI